MLTPASIKGLDIHSFHQNCLSTRRHRGRAGLGSMKGTAVDSRDCPSDFLSRAPRPARSSCCFWSFMDSSRLCWSDRVRSRHAINEGIIPWETQISLTKVMGKVHTPLGKFANTLSYNLCLYFQMPFLDSRGRRSSRSQYSPNNFRRFFLRIFHQLV